MLAGINVYRGDYMQLGAKDNPECPECPYLDLIMTIHNALWRRRQHRISRRPAPHGVLPATIPRREQYAPYQQDLDR